MRKVHPIPESQARDILAFLTEVHGRPVTAAEVPDMLRQTWRVAKAATANADKARRLAGTKKRTEELAKARMAVATSLGRQDLLQSIFRSDEARKDTWVTLERPGSEGEVITRSTRQAEHFTRAVTRTVEVDMSQMTGVVGTPFAGGTPFVEESAALYPYQGRGLSYDQGQFMAAYRADAVIREGVGNLVSVVSGATIEVCAPPGLSDGFAELLGVDRNQLDKVAAEINAELMFGAVDFAGAFEEQLRTAIVNGFGIYEFALAGRDVPVGRRITGLQPRLPNTVMRWVQDPFTGELVGIQQTNPNGGVYTTVNSYAPFLDARKCCILSIDRDGDNYEGLSLVRSARGWDILGMEVQSASILHWQRFGPGVPILRRNSAAPNSGAASDTAFQALSQYANMADSVLELGDGIDVELLQMQMDTGLVEILDMCAKYKRSAIRDSVAGLGSEGVGSFAMTDIKSQLWLKGLSVFARQIERAWSRLIRAYCDMYHPGMAIYPVMRVSGFATRSPAEVLTLQQTFAGIVTSGTYTDKELSEIAEKAEIVWDGRGTEADLIAGEADAEPAEPAPTEGKPAPGAAQRNAALGRRHRRTAAEKWEPSIADAALTKRIASGGPLSRGDLRDIEAFFAGIEGDPTAHPEWADKGPFWQAFMAFGGQDMADWLGVELADVDATAPESAPETEPIEDPELPDDPPATTRAAPKKYAHIDFTPPEGVRAAAKRGLEVRASKPPSERGGTEVGVARARDLSNGREVSPDTARRMKAYFDRHEVDKKGETWDEQGKGWQAWMLWGGDPGQSWSSKLVRQMNAADEDDKPRSIPGFGRTECDCGECEPIARAKRTLFAVPTRTGQFMTWRELQPVEQSVAFDRIADEKDAATKRMTRAIEAEQRAHRAAYAQAAQPLIDRRDVAGIAALNIDYTERYRQAMLPALRSLAEFANSDMLAEIAAQIGSNTWVATSDTVTGSAAQVEAAATLAAKAVNDRVNEQLRGAALQVANGARPSTLTAAPVSIGNTAGGLLEQAASTTVNETRAVTAAEQGPKIERAVYSAVMDRYTCPECARADGTEVEYGSERYRRLSPPNPRCRSVVNSGGTRNLCQCVWVYEYATPTVGPGPVNATRPGGLVVRSKPGAVRLNLVVGLPGSGKSTWAATQPGVVIDRDEYVLTAEGYDPAGRAESLTALTEALQSAAPGETVHFVACLLSASSRRAIVEYAEATADRDLDVVVTVAEADADRVREVNAARAETRGSIPPEQLEHMIDAWETPTEDEGAIEYIGG